MCPLKVHSRVGKIEEDYRCGYQIRTRPQKTHPCVGKIGKEHRCVYQNRMRPLKVLCAEAAWSRCVELISTGRNEHNYVSYLQQRSVWGFGGLIDWFFCRCISRTARESSSTSSSAS